MATFPVPAPIYGLNDDKALSKQPPGTTRDCLNVRAQDPVEKRERISQRSGLSDITAPWRAQVNGSNKVQHLGVVTFGQSNVDYAEISDANLSGTSEWTQEFQGKAARHVKVDRQNNAYWVVGRDLLVKTNAQGEIVWKFTVPLKETTHTIRALAIDDLSNAWVASGAVSEFSDSTFTKNTTFEDTQDNNCIWRISARTNVDLDEEPEVTGEYPTTGFVNDLAVRFGYVYFVQNRQDTFEADLIILSGFGVNSLVTSTSPVQVALRGVPYPVNSLAVNSSGEVVVSSEPFANRTENPKYPNLSRVNTPVNLPGMWTPHANLKTPLYSEYRPSLQPQANGSSLSVLTDQTGNARDFSTAQADATGDSRAPFSDPTYLERVIGDAPGIRFDGSSTGMATQTNLSFDYRDRGGAQRTAWPSYGSFSGSPKAADDTSAMFVYFILCRVVREATRGAIIGQEREAAYSPTGGPHGIVDNPFVVCANRSQHYDATAAGSAVSGLVSVYDYIGEGAVDFQSTYTPQGSTNGSVRFPREGDLNGTRTGDNDSEDPADPPVALITLLVDNAVDDGATDDLATRALWRLNGQPMDRWSGSIHISDKRVTLGFADDTNTLGDDFGIFNGDIVYMACVARQDPTSLTEPKVIEHQFTSRTTQRFGIQVSATGGTFDITFTQPDGTTETLAGVAYNRTAANFETDLQGMTMFNAEDVTVTGTDLTVGDVQIHIGYDTGAAKPSATSVYSTGQYHGVDLATPTTDDSGLSGGSATTFITRPVEVEDGIAGSWDGHVAGPGKDLEKFEGWIMHEHGCQHLLPGPHNDASVLFRHPYSVTPPLDENAVDPLDLLSTNAIIAKYGGGDLSLKWVETDKGGVGYGLVADKDDNLVTVGPTQSSPSDTDEYQFITDDGDSVTFAASGAFQTGGFQDRHVKMDTDDDKNVYIPRYPTAHTAIDDGGAGIAAGAAGAGVATFTRTTGSWVDDGLFVGGFVRAAGFTNGPTNADWEVSIVTALTLTVLDPGDVITTEAAGAGKTITRIDYVTAQVFDSSGTGELTYSSSATADDIVGAYAAASPFGRPDYGAGSTIDRDEFLYVATNPTPPGGGTADNGVIRKVRLVSSTPNSNPPRETRLYAVAGGAIRKWDGTDSYDAIGTVESGDDQMSSTATYYSSAELLGKLYLSDGVGKLRVVEPAEAPAATGRAALLKADDGGEVPERARHVFAWRGRLGVANLADRPHYWKLAEIGRPKNWNEFPPAPFVGQAISGVNSPETGESADIINAVVTGSDDYLLFGGDRSITALVGDPTASGLVARGDLGQSIGQFQTVTDSTGMAFGKPWARDKSDTIFFYSSRGEAFAMRVGGKPEPISDRAIEKRLQQVDFSTHYVDARWNAYDNTVHFFVMPYGAATQVIHHVFDVQRGKLMEADGDAIATGWWRDRFDHDDVQPTAAVVFDADSPGDRALFIGCADGRVRKWDPTANNDDQSAAGSKVKIDAYCDYGPLAPPSASGEFMFTGLEVDLDRNQSGALVEYLSADTADFPSTPASASIQLQAGYNPPLLDRVAGSYCGFRIRNSAQDQRFAVDRVMLDGSPMGARRQRTMV